MRLRVICSSSPVPSPGEGGGDGSCSPGPSAEADVRAALAAAATVLQACLFKSAALAEKAVRAKAAKLKATLGEDPATDSAEEDGDEKEPELELQLEPEPEPEPVAGVGSVAGARLIKEDRQALRRKYQALIAASGASVGPTSKAPYVSSLATRSSAAQPRKARNKKKVNLSVET